MIVTESSSRSNRLTNCWWPRVRTAGVSASVALSLFTTSLVGCSTASYPTQSDINATAPEVPGLETIADGKAYLVHVRNGMIDQKTTLQNIETGFDAGIVGGVVTAALSAALKWSNRTTIKAGIFTGALIGVDSTLSIKTQVQIINKGLDALVCVESQAAAAYTPLKQLDGILAPTAADIRNLEAEIKNLAGQTQGDDLATLLGQAKADLATAKAWLLSESGPIAIANAGVQVGVDTVLQTTIDQLNAALPDGSAFAKIPTSLPTTATPTQPPATPVPGQTVQAAPTAAETANAKHYRLLTTSATAAPTATDARTTLYKLDQTLHTDMSAANAALSAPGLVSPPAQLPTINCPLASGTSPASAQPLQISALSGTLSTGTASTVTTTIIGGTAPYKAEIMVGSGAGLTPGAIQAAINGTTVTLTGTPPVGAGSYNLVVTDNAGNIKTAAVTAK